MKKLLWLSISEVGDGSADQLGYVTDWDEIAPAIERVYRLGGRVNLDVVSTIDERSHEVLAGIAIYAEPGLFHLLVTPEEGGHLRTWWSGGEFRGAEQFYDDTVRDQRLICSDVQVAKELFEDFFRSGGVSQRLKGDTQSTFG